MIIKGAGMIKIYAYMNTLKGVRTLKQGLF